MRRWDDLNEFFAYARRDAEDALHDKLDRVSQREKSARQQETRALSPMMILSTRHEPCGTQRDEEVEEARPQLGAWEKSVCRHVWRQGEIVRKKIAQSY